MQISSLFSTLRNTSIPISLSLSLLFFYCHIWKAEAPTFPTPDRSLDPIFPTRASSGVTAGFALAMDELKTVLWCKRECWPLRNICICSWQLISPFNSLWTPGHVSNPDTGRAHTQNEGQPHQMLAEAIKSECCLLSRWLYMCVVWILTSQHRRA